MRSLYLKIFLWFWVAVVCLIAVSLFITYTLRRDSLVEPFRIGSAQHSIDAQTAASIYEKQGRDGVDGYISRLDRSTGIRSYLFNNRGQRVGGPAPNPMVTHLAHNAMRKHYDPGLILGRIYRVQPAEGPSGRWYTFISMAHPFADDHGALIIRLAAVALTATLVCLALAHHITAPIKAMRAATREIAMGRFGTRLGTTVGKRGDELGWLANDFDKMASQLEALLESQQRLLADISHELRSPLTRLNVALEIARRDGVNGAPAAFDRIERESHRLNELIAELTTITRLESGVNAARSQSVDMVELVRDVITDADFEARSRDDRRVEFADTHPLSLTILGEPELLGRAVENVVRNALKYTAPSTSVEVSVSKVRLKGNDFCRITVRDHGVGVPESSLRDIFKPFYRLDAARDRQSGGVGLGLAIVDRAVTLHGGTVRAANALGGGLEVTITLPVRTPRKYAKSPVASS